MSNTIIIVNWNSGVLLAKCLAHLKNQTVRPTQVLIVDNASADDSVSGANAYKNVTVLAMDTNLGFAAGNNRALAECKTEFVALLNPDAFPEENWLARLLAAADEHPEIAMFGSRQLCHDQPALLDGMGDKYHCSGLVWREGHGALQRDSDLVAREIFSPCAAAALYRRQALLDVGGFDESYFCYVEDVDLGFRLRLAGHSAMYVPDAVVHHVGSATTGGQHSDFSVYHGHRNMIWTYVKNMPGALFWLYLPLHIAVNIGVVVCYILQGRWRIILKSKKDATTGIPRMWCKRRLIQGKRNASVHDIWLALDKSLWPRRFNKILWRGKAGK
jgi:GT2 family glycosyltransferase